MPAGTGPAGGGDGGGRGGYDILLYDALLYGAFKAPGNVAAEDMPAGTGPAGKGAGEGGGGGLKGGAGKEGGARRPERGQGKSPPSLRPCRAPLLHPLPCGVVFNSRNSTLLKFTLSPPCSVPPFPFPFPLAPYPPPTCCVDQHPDRLHPLRPPLLPLPFGSTSTPTVLAWDTPHTPPPPPPHITCGVDKHPNGIGLGHRVLHQPQEHRLHEQQADHQNARACTH